MAPKTNAVRIVETEKIAHNVYTYDFKGDPPDGPTVAGLINKPPQTVFKTLVTFCGKNNYIFVVPVTAELDLKAAARAVGEKNIEMLPVKELLKTTGYVKGGCSPIGMKKLFPTVLDKSAEMLPAIIVSAGKPGMQIELSPADLVKITAAKTAEITRNKDD